MCKEWQGEIQMNIGGEKCYRFNKKKKKPFAVGSPARFYTFLLYSARHEEKKWHGQQKAFPLLLG